MNIIPDTRPHLCDLMRSELPSLCRSLFLSLSTFLSLVPDSTILLLLLSLLRSALLFPTSACGQFHDAHTRRCTTSCGQCVNDLWSFFNIRSRQNCDRANMPTREIDVHKNKAINFNYNLCTSHMPGGLPIYPDRLKITRHTSCGLWKFSGCSCTAMRMLPRCRRVYSFASMFDHFCLGPNCRHRAHSAR